MGVVIRRQKWLECVDVVIGWCCKEVMDLLILYLSLYYTSISSFLQQHPLLLCLFPPRSFIMY